MRPINPVLDFADTVIRDGEHCADLGLSKVALFRQLTNLPDIAFRKPRHWMILTLKASKSNRICMALIVAWCKIFKVIKPIIRWVAVFVVNFKPFWTGAEKGGGYNPWNRRSDATGCFAEMNVVPSKRILFFDGIGFKYKSWSCTVTAWSVSSYSSKIRDGIDLFKTDNWLPNFGLSHIGSLSYFVDGHKI